MRISKVETKTMAEILYAQQHVEKALAMFQRLLQKSPDDLQLKRRVNELQAELNGQSGSPKVRRLYTLLERIQTRR